MSQDVDEGITVLFLMSIKNRFVKKKNRSVFLRKGQVDGEAIGRNRSDMANVSLMHFLSAGNRPIDTKCILFFGMIYCIYVIPLEFLCP